MNKRNSVISFKNKIKITAIALFKEEKNMLPWNEGIHFLVPKLANQFISFSSVVYNCWSQSTRSKAISVFVLFTEVAPSIHLEKWMKLDWLPQDPQFFSQDGPESLSMEFGPYGAIPFFCIMQKKGKCVFFPKRIIILHMIISPWYISINFNVINNNFCVVDPFMLYMSYNLSTSFILEQIIIN